MVFVGAAVTLAYWDQLLATEDATITIGENVSLDVEVDVPASGTLVPTGAILKTGDVDEVVMSYNVQLSAATSENLDLTVAASDVKIGGATTYASLVNVAINSPATINSTNAVVTVTVTLIEPADETTYLAIKGQPITFTLTFTATVA